MNPLPFHKLCVLALMFACLACGKTDGISTEPTPQDSENTDPLTRSVAETPSKAGLRPALPHFDYELWVSQCGAANDLRDVEDYKSIHKDDVSKKYVQTHEPSTVQLQWLSKKEIAGILGKGYDPGNVYGQRWCTGTLISERLVLTAGHCLDVQNVEDDWISPYRITPHGDKEYVLQDKLATLFKVNFNYQKNGSTGKVRAGESVRIKKLIEHRNGKLDYAIVELAEDVDKILKKLTITKATVVTRSPKKDENIAIIQHPNGQPKKVESGSIKGLNVKDVWYSNVDTFYASSGSGIRDGAGKVIGVHTHGGCDASIGANYGVSTAAISLVSKEF